jgi:D-alanyl-D-alanine carboxypeptidase (penicillin-binding protein 5/6)
LSEKAWGIIIRHIQAFDIRIYDILCIMQRGTLLIFRFVSVFIFVFASLFSPFLPAIDIARANEVSAGDINTDKVAVDSAAAYLIDTGTGEVLYSKAADSRRAVASTTKVMTGLLVLENSRLEEEVLISPHVAATGGAVIGLKAGERRTVGDLMYAMMLVSANDAAVALAEHVAGSEAGFADLMNLKAQELGARDSHFTVPNGLAPGAVHYSTAADMALITRAAMNNPVFRRYVSTKQYQWDTRSAAGTRILHNTNDLLDSYAPAVGVKTGFLNESGYCLIGEAQTAGRSVIAVILGSGTRDGSFDDDRKLLDWSLREFDFRRLVKKDQRYVTIKLEGKSVPLVADHTIQGLVYLGDESGLVFRPRLDPGISLPLNQGDRVGYLEVVHSGKTERVNLRVGRSVWSSYASRNVSGYLRRVVKKMINLF